MDQKDGDEMLLPADYKKKTVPCLTCKDLKEKCPSRCGKNKGQYPCALCQEHGRICVPPENVDDISEYGIESRIKDKHRFFYDQFDLKTANKAAAQSGLKYQPLNWSRGLRYFDNDADVLFWHGSSSTFSESCPHSKAPQYLPAHAKQMLDYCLNVDH